MKKKIEKKKRLKKVLIWGGVTILVIGGAVWAIKTGKLSTIGNAIKLIPASALKEAGIKTASFTGPTILKKMFSIKNNMSSGNVFSCVAKRSAMYVAEGYDEEQAMQLAAFE
jgi:hypothetical protein